MQKKRKRERERPAILDWEGTQPNPTQHHTLSALAFVSMQTLTYIITHFQKNKQHQIIHLCLFLCAPFFSQFSLHIFRSSLVIVGIFSTGHFVVGQFKSQSVRKAANLTGSDSHISVSKFFAIFASTIVFVKHCLMSIHCVVRHIFSWFLLNKNKEKKRKEKQYWNSKSHAFIIFACFSF